MLIDAGTIVIVGTAFTDNTVKAEVAEQPDPFVTTTL